MGSLDPVAGDDVSVAEFIVLAPGEGKTVTVLGDTYTYKARAADTAGHYGLVELIAPAGSPGPPPHIHEGEEEALYVVDGELRVQVGQQTMQVLAGAFILVPRGTTHTFSNPSSKPAKVLVLVSPAGFESAFEEMAQVAPRADQPPDMEKLLAIARKYNLRIVGA
jgi:mannose-6-phosphate isomerase-like protein (cupin superfamily)